MGILSYVPVTFFVPLVTGTHKTSPFVKFHVNQGTIVAIGALALWVISIILSAVIRVPRVSWYGLGYGYVTPGWLTAILTILSLAVLVPSVMGILNVIGAKMKELPIIGKFRIIK